MAEMKASEITIDSFNLQSTYGILFFGVPNRGMDVEALASMVGRMPSRSTLNILDQQVGHQQRARHHARFCKAFDYADSRIIQFYELKMSPTISQDPVTGRYSRCGEPRLLVSPDSAACGRHWEVGGDYLKSLNANHSTMVKFRENDQDGQERVLEILKDFAMHAPATIASRVDLGPDSNNSRSLTRRLSPGAVLLETNEIAKLIDQHSDCLQSLFYTEMNDRRDAIADAANGTCEWLQTHPTYIEWLGQRSGLLWVKGNPGAGKSTLMRHVVDKVKRRPPSGWLLAYFYFHKRGSQIQQSPLGLFRSLLHQILREAPGPLLDFSRLFKTKSITEGKFGDKWDWKLADLKGFFKDHVARSTENLKIRLYLDAMDECGEESARDLIEFFDSLTVSSASHQVPLSICFSCRHYPIRALKRGLQIIVDKENRRDITVYAEQGIRREIDDEKAVGEILERVNALSSGNFQWTKFAVLKATHLKRKGANLKVIKQAIRQLPPDLSGMYENLFSDISEDDRTCCVRVMRWVCFAITPLSLDTMRLAAVVDTNTSHKTIQDCEDDENFIETDHDLEIKIKDLSRGLLEVIKTPRNMNDLPFGVHPKNRIQFIHQSVADYMLQSGLRKLEQSPFPTSQRHAHLRLVDVCLKCLEMRICTTWENPHGDDIYDLVWNRHLFGLVLYAGEHLGHHAQEAETDGNIQSDLRDRFTGLSDAALAKWILILQGVCHPILGHGTTLLHICAFYGLTSVAARLLETKSYMLNVQDSIERTPLSIAAYMEQVEVTQLLLSKDGILVNLSDEWGETPLSYAVKKRNLSIVKLLINRSDVRADPRNKSGHSPFLGALLRQHKEIIHIFLDRDDVQVDLPDKTGRTTLSYAAELGSTSGVQLLLSRKKVQADLKDEKGRTPLSYAATGRDEGVMRLLLRCKDIQVNSRDRYGRSPLSYAAEIGSFSTVQLLIEWGSVDPDSRDYQGRSPLSYAAERNNEAVIRLFLGRRSVDINQQDNTGRSPLSFTAANEYGAEKQGQWPHGTLYLLLGAGCANANTQDFEGNTALSYAVCSSRLDMVKCLFRYSGILPDVKNNTGQTPFAFAVAVCCGLRWGAIDHRTSATSESICGWIKDTLHIRLLSASMHSLFDRQRLADATLRILASRSDVEIDSKDNEGRSALATAAENGFEDVVQLARSAASGSQAVTEYLGPSRQARGFSSYTD